MHFKTFQLLAVGINCEVITITLLQGLGCPARRDAFCAAYMVKAH